MAIEIAAPVDGAIVAVHVERGEAVSKDSHLFTIEKAKTLLIVRSTVEGIVCDLNVAVGDDVALNFVAVRIEESQA